MPVTLQAEHILYSMKWNGTLHVYCRHIVVVTKIPPVSNYAFFTLLHKWGDRGQTHRLEKLQQYTSSDEIGITHEGVFLINASALYQPIHAIM